MKVSLFLPVFAAAGFLFHPVTPGQSTNTFPVSDSNMIRHVLDGTVKEWPAAKFAYDGETGIQYAIDNDANNLFIAINIPDSRMQIKMMRNGMSTYLDVKGKKKEGKGIEFPEKNENAEAAFKSPSTGGASPSENGEQKKPDVKAIRKMLALNLVALQLFGFNKEALDQQLMLPNSVNLAFTWDSADVMHIEYQVPFSLLGDASSLDQKEISVGWNIHAFEMPKSEAGPAPSEGGRGYGGGGYGGGGGRRGGGGYRGGGGGNGNMGNMQRMMESQRFWAKYTIAVPPAGKKAF